MNHAQMCTHFEREFLRKAFTYAVSAEPYPAIAAEHVAGANDSWFTSEERRMMIGLMRELADDGKPFDDMSVYELARKKGCSEAVSDENVAIQEHEPKHWPVGSAAALVMDRCAKWLADEAERRARDEKLEDAKRHIAEGRNDEAREQLDSVWDADASRREQAASFKDLLGAILAEAIEPPKPDDHAGAFPLFDELEPFVGRIADGSLTIVGGGPSDGKSATMLQACINLAAHRRRPFYVSGEDPLETVQERLATKFTRIGRFDIRKIGFEQQKKIEAYYKLKAASESWVGVPTSRSLADFRRCMRRAVSRHNADVLFVDYLNIIQAPGSDFEKTSVAVNGIKEEAQQLGVPVVLGCQFNRSGRERNTEPFMSSLRGSGVIEEVAENILLLWRSGEYPSEQRHLKIEKAKSGRSGVKFNLDWHDDGRMCVGLKDFEASDDGPRNGARY